VWHIGYLVDGSEYLQVAQSTTAEAGFIPEQTSGGTPQGETTVGGLRWQRYESEGRRSVVSVEEGVTTVVSGTLTWPGIEAAAGALRRGSAVSG
jgi:hypothetical protein